MSLKMGGDNFEYLDISVAMIRRFLVYTVACK